MGAITDLGVKAIRDGVAAGQFSAREVAEGFNANVAASQASLNGKSPHAPLAWQPDLFTTHEGRYVAVEVKSLSSRGRGGPAAGGSVNKPRTPAPGAPPTARAAHRYGRSSSSRPHTG